LSPTISDTTKTPKPSAFYKWFVVLGCVLLWASPAFLVIPRLPENIFVLTLAELGCFALLVYLLSKGLSWFGVEFTDDGARKRGAFERRFVPWSEATIYRQGLVILIWSPKGTIKVNSAVYPSSRVLNEYLAARTTGGTPANLSQK
jgi:hypothetical protein